MGRGYNWLCDEIASAGRENLDVDHVARYDAKEDADAASELVLLQQLGLHRQSEVVDLGAGTGQFALTAAAACARVVAVDVSSVMLQRLQAKLSEANLSNVEVVQAGFLTYEHRGRPADFVYSRFALHHLPDFWKAVALARVRRIVRPGGVLRLWDVVYDFDPAAAEERIKAWCATGGSGVEGEWSRAELEEHVRDEHSTFRWLLEPMIARCGFAIEEAGYSQLTFRTPYPAHLAHVFLMAFEPRRGHNQGRSEVPKSSRAANVHRGSEPCLG
jgi:ubiquinone/menaquinone biosynthesis C-methylase UbiE